MTTKELFKYCDDYFKIFIIIWIKLREFYIESQNKNFSLPTTVKKTTNFLKNIRKQCTKIERFKKIVKYINFLEQELIESNKFIDKLQHIALMAQIFDLPEPINNLINNLGLNQIENNDFAKQINDLFENIDEIDKIDLKKNINIIDESIQEGTLVNFLKNKQSIPVPVSKSNYKKDYKNSTNSTNSTSYFSPEFKYSSKPESRLSYDFKSEFHPDFRAQNMKNININPIPRFATPNPRTQYRYH